MNELVSRTVEQIIVGILVHGFDNDENAELVLRGQTSGIARVIQHCLGDADRASTKIAMGQTYGTIGNPELPEFPKIGSTWRHHSGRIYRVEGITNAETERQDEYPTTVVYRNVVNLKAYSRKLVDWHRSMTFMTDDVPLLDQIKLEAKAVRIQADRMSHEGIHPGDYVEEKVTLVAFTHAIRVIAEERQKAIDEIRKAAPQPPVIATFDSTNAWIQEQIARHTFPDDGTVDATGALEVAQEAFLRAVGDIGSLVTNLANLIHRRNVTAGWWNDPRTGEDLYGKRNIGELLCLVHSEISEAMEGHRKSLPDDKLTHRPMFRVELIDAMIRLLDILGSEDNEEHPAGTIFVEKLNFNATRPDHRPENRLKEGGKKY